MSSLKRACFCKMLRSDPFPGVIANSSLARNAARVRGPKGRTADYCLPIAKPDFFRVDRKSSRFSVSAVERMRPNTGMLYAPFMMRSVSWSRVSWSAIQVRFRSPLSAMALYGMAEKASHLVENHCPFIYRTGRSPYNVRSQGRSIDAG